MRFSINRIRLEFKVSSAIHSEKRNIVLIESDWNLKPLRIPQEVSSSLVLIESDWNLKQSSRSPLVSRCGCINRIRLEFKGQSALRSVYICRVLIESDWNLKLVYSYPLVQCRFCINRIRLEFKAVLCTCRRRPCTGINRIRLEFKAG